MGRPPALMGLSEAPRMATERGFSACNRDMRTSSIQRQGFALDHLPPIRDLLGDALAERRGRHHHGLALAAEHGADAGVLQHADRKSTRLNSSHSQSSYAVFCLKKKKKLNIRDPT